MDKKKKILWVLTRFFLPLNTGGKIRTINIIRQLKKYYDIDLICFEPPPEDAHLTPELRALVSDLILIPFKEYQRRSFQFYIQLLTSFFSRLPYAIYKYRSKKIINKLREYEYDWHYAFILSDFLPSTVSTSCINKKKILFEHNVEWEIWDRLRKESKGIFKKILFHFQYKWMKKYEIGVQNEYDLCLTVSERDKDTFERENKKVQYAVVPTGVDIEFYTPCQSEIPKKTLCFTGDLEWIPNVEGLVRFCFKMWPLIVKQYLNARFIIIGRNPGRETLQLAKKCKGVELYPDVPDIRPYLQQASAYVIPLWAGGGTRIKAFEAMASGLPVISTRVGIEGLNLKKDTDYLEANDSKEFLDKISWCFENPINAQQLGMHGRRLMEEKYSWERSAKIFYQHCEAV